MDSVSDINGPELIDPGLDANGGGGFIGVNAPDLGPVGIDTTALQELGGLVGGPLDPLNGGGNGGGGAPSKPKKESKKTKKVTETVDIKVDVIKKGSKKDKSDKTNGNGKKPNANGDSSGSGTNIQTGSQKTNGGLQPGDIVDPSVLLAGALGGKEGGSFNVGLLDSANGGPQGGLPGHQGGAGPPIGILIDGPSSKGIMGNAGADAGGFGGGGKQNGGFDGPGLDILPGNGGHAQGDFGFNGGQGNFDPQAGNMDGFGFDAFSAGAQGGSGQNGGSGSDGGGQMFQANGRYFLK
jgi:hypothetical protein